MSVGLFLFCKGVHLCHFLDTMCGSDGKESTCSVGDLSLIPGLGRSPGEEKGYPLQYSGLETSMACIVHGVTKRWARLRTFTHISDITDICVSLSDLLHLV